jgi:alkanesulfonate monooxygenase SsuD/methylene tetrahydromethanopterin reductase-like flavin-dependent oxidoreductase (luciferase family)
VHPLRVGVVVVQNLPWEAWRERVLDVERLGYDAVYAWDHLIHRTQSPDDPLFEGMTSLAAAAADTSRIRLGTLVASPTLRSPLLLAKQAMTVDQVSGGRMELGIGAAGSQLDYSVLGLQPWSPRELVERFTETVELVDTVLRGGTSYRGRHWSGEGMTAAPGCVQAPRLPLTLAAHGPRALRVAGRYADTWNSITPRDLPRDEGLALTASLSRQLDEAAREAGREPSSIRRSVLVGAPDWPVRQSPAAFRDAVLRYRDIGVTDVVLMHPDNPAEARVGHGAADPDIVRRIGEDLLPGLRAELA